MEFKVILSADDKSGHLDFLPLVSAGWRKFFDVKIALILISNDANIAETVMKYVDNLCMVPYIDNQWVMCQAKMARLWYACKHGSDVCMFDDIDLVPLQREWRAKIVAQRQPGHLMLVGEEYYESIPHEKGKAPSGMMTAESDLFKEIINPDDLSYPDFFWKWKGTHVFDGREDPTGHEANFSDESLFRVMRSRWDKRDTHIDHIIRSYHYNAPYILDRAQWACDVSVLNAGGYWEGHLSKPPKQYREQLLSIYNYIGIPCNL
jgi:hypothetical protein